MKVTALEEVQVFVRFLLHRRLYSLSNFIIQKLSSDIYIYIGHQYLVQSCDVTHSCFFSGVYLWMMKRHVPRTGNKIVLLLQKIFLNYSINRQCMTSMKTTNFLFLDETLYPMRNQVVFKQCNTNKPVRYGLLFKSVNSARYLYKYVTSPYSGKL